MDKLTIEAFRRAFYGQTLLPDYAGYDSARRIWNASIDKHPGLIARCSGGLPACPPRRSLFIAMLRNTRARNLRRAGIRDHSPEAPLPSNSASSKSPIQR